MRCPTVWPFHSMSLAAVDLSVTGPVYLLMCQCIVALYSLCLRRMCIYGVDSAACCGRAVLLPQSQPSHILTLYILCQTCHPPVLALTSSNATKRLDMKTGPGSKRNRKQDDGPTANKRLKVENFKHDPLSDPNTTIRLLRILPGKPDEDIRLQSSEWLFPPKGSYKNGDSAQHTDSEQELGYQLERETGTPTYHCADNNAESTDGDDQYRDAIDLPDHAPPYNAISYTWGTDAQKKTLYVDNKMLKVRKSCYYALWQARLQYPGDYAAIFLDKTRCISVGLNL